MIGFSQRFTQFWPHVSAFKLGRRLLYVAPLLFFALFYFWPLSNIFGLSFRADRDTAVSLLTSLTETSYYLDVIWFTTWQAAVSTLLTLAFALPAAYVFAQYHFPGKSTLKALSTLPFVLPTVVVANAFTALLGPRGLVNNALVDLFMLDTPPINLQHSLWMIFLAHVFYNYSVALRLLSGYWQNLPQDVGQAATMLGASPRRVFWTITLPLLRPALTATAVLIFIFCFTSFGVVLILGGPQFATLEVAIYEQAIVYFNLPVAAALAMIQIIFTFVLMWFYTATQSRMARPSRLVAAQANARPMRTRRDRFIVGGNLLFMLILLGLPLVALVWRSFSGPDGLWLRYYTELFVNARGSVFFVPPIQAVRNSIMVALTTMVTAVVLGLISASFIADSGASRLRRLLDPLFMLPLATSAVTLGFGYILTFNRPPVRLADSWLIMPLAHTLVAMPFVIRAVLPALRRISPSLREAAGMLGAGHGRVWLEVDWPLMRPAVVVGAVFAFTMSMGEFGASLFLARPDFPTMPVAIYRFLGQPGPLNYGQALAMSCLLMLVCAVGFIAIERFRLGDEGEF